MSFFCREKTTTTKKIIRGKLIESSKFIYCLVYIKQLNTRHNNTKAPTQTVTFT